MILALAVRTDTIGSIPENPTSLVPEHRDETSERVMALRSPSQRSEQTSTAAGRRDTGAAVEQAIAAFLDAFERASVSEFAWVSTSSVASTVSVSTSLPDDHDHHTDDGDHAHTPKTISSNAAASTAAASAPQRTKSVVDRLSVESMELEAARDVNAFLLALERKLQTTDLFSGEEERTKWWWLAHQLKQQRQQRPAKWDALADASLARIELALSALPTASRDAHARSDDGASDSFYSADEVRISINDIAMLERPSARQQTPPVDDDTTWANFSRIVREASGRTVRALIGASERDSELVSVNSSTGAGTRSRSGSGTTTDALRESIPTLQRSSSSFSQSVPHLLRSVVSYLGLSMEETFMCQICFENVSLAKAYKLRKCSHLFCEACLANYLEFKISEAQVYPTCFHQDGDAPACSDEIVPDDIRAVVSADAWTKYTKFKFNKEHENARQCPHCDHSQVYPGREAPECVCDACGGEFCFVHSTAHRGRTCAEYEKKIVAIEKLNHAMINEISKPCPGCNNFVEKIGTSLPCVRLVSQCVADADDNEQAGATR